MKNILLFLTIFMLFGCEQKDKNVSLFVYNDDDAFIDTMIKYIKYESKGVLNLNTFDSNSFQIVQDETIEKRISAGDDLMIINPVDRLSAYAIIKKLKSENIPVIFFNREPLSKDLELWNKAYYVGTKGIQSAQIQAEIIANLFDHHPQSLNKHDKNKNGAIETVIIKGEQGHQDAEIRTTEVVEYLKKLGFKVNILIIEVADWNRFKAYEKMKNIINEFGDEIELVISNNDSMAIGAITAMRQANLFLDDNNNGKIDKDDTAWIPVIGIDGIDDAVKLIKDGFLYGTVLNDSKAQSKAIVELADCILNKKNFNLMNYKLIDNQYIMIDYKILQ